MRRVILLLACVLFSACSTHGDRSLVVADSEAADVRIRDGLTRLGASEQRGDCFGRRIASSLNEADAEQAALIVESADSKAEMRNGVMSASGQIRKAFVGANFGCSFFG